MARCYEIITLMVALSCAEALRLREDHGCHDQEVFPMLHMVMDILKKNAFEHFLDAGTALDVYRSGKIHPGEYDADVGVWGEDYPRILDAIRRDLPTGFVLCDLGTEEEGSHKGVINQFNVKPCRTCPYSYSPHIDLYPYLREDIGLVRMDLARPRDADQGTSYGPAPTSMVLPLATGTLNGISFPVPRDVHAYSLLRYHCLGAIDIECERDPETEAKFRGKYYRPILLQKRQQAARELTEALEKHAGKHADMKAA